MVNARFWKNRKVFITGHTGFKGSWMCVWLHALGARITGYALNPPTDPNLFHLAKVGPLMDSLRGDVRDREKLAQAVRKSKPEIVFHLAAQPLVRESYSNPYETYEINVCGTVSLFEAVRKAGSVRAVVNVTTDKCYENKEWLWGYRENDILGGYDPYSNSKACSELATTAVRSSFFHPREYRTHHTAIATARAGNVIGGGDWAADRLVPDCIRSLLNNKQIILRSPQAIRPWQHVLEPLCGYLMLAERLYQDGPAFGEGWNFGPDEQDCLPVEEVVRLLCAQWPGNKGYEIDRRKKPHEAALLKLDFAKAKTLLGWRPKWNIEQAVDAVIEWTLAYNKKESMRKICLRQIESYSA